ncbi:preprotein translocase subunit YajC [Anaeromassilibacillus sp. An172]|uniref:preprotein translocase subunit YajC n=1 Tax=Anaeromassilibacillus sp. An172 TaxID=1965570 RepID=UPI000B3650AC|nr:preprotein translocase subunit YajC [Anaeromassilibacillus sp. An172]MEE0761782.1 preprotein translocase subunit YajC [Acutalibacteraceae bacterium]OUP79557.1 preprotein translocase subunit YajC [Anaeromassilibacillus sp. An172]
MNLNFFDTAAGTDGTSFLMIIVIYAAIFGLLYLFLIRPKSKRQKQDQKMRESLEIGDEITTIGGIMGRVIAIRDDEDAIIIETGSDRVKMKLKRWSISTVDTEKELPAEEKKSKGWFKKNKSEDKNEETK